MYICNIHIYILSHLQGHFPKDEAKLGAEARGSLFTEAWQKRPTSCSFELWKMTLEVGQAVYIYMGRWVVNFFWLQQPI